MDKKELRRDIKERRKNLDLDTRENSNLVIRKKILDLKEFDKSKIVFTYVSYNNEVDTIKLIEKMFDCNKKVCVPKVIDRNGHMEAYLINSFNDLKKTGYGILEPFNSNLVKHEDIDFAIVPGLAFDKKGGRLGYGGGYYDRYLSKSVNAYKVGVAFDCQIVPDVPLEETDVKLDRIITFSYDYVI